MKKILLLLSALALVVAGCKKDEGENVVNSVREGASIPTQKSPSNAGEVEKTPTNINIYQNKGTNSEGENFSFQAMSGSCLNKIGEEGRNYKKMGECGDLSQEKVGKVDLTNTLSLKGLDLRGSDLSESRVNLNSFINNEVLFDETTVFPSKLKRPMEKAGLIIRKSQTSLARKIKKLRWQFKERKQRYRKLSSKLKDLPPSKQKSFKKGLKKMRKALRKRKQQLAQYRNKLTRLGSGYSRELGL